MSWTDRRKRFRAILEGQHCIFPASVFDPISARIAEDLGFEAGMFAGSVASLTILGAPDSVIISLTEFAEQCLRISRAGQLPLLVDADHGYGNALNVHRTVGELDIAGVAALTIEDTALPIPFDDGTAAPLISLEEGVGKMRAAVAGRANPELVIAARTKATSAGLDDLVARVKAYAATGVDAVFLSSVKTREQVDALHAATSLPLMLGQVSGEIADKDYLASRNVRIALQGHAPFMAAVQAVHDTLSALRNGTPASDLSGVASTELIDRVSRKQAYDALAKETLRRT